MSRFGSRNLTPLKRRTTVSNASITPPNTPPEPPAAGGTTAASVSDSDYATRCKLLHGLQKDLLSLGAEKFFALPKITVIGAQSAGKSSLIEGVSGINVPRDSGTCTRCPMQINMSSDADSWSCTIWLRKEYDQNGTQLSTSERIPFGPTITERRDVEIWLRRAQAAILSPHRLAQDFFNKSAQDIVSLIKTDKEMLQFSQNVIEVTLKDPNATDLSFVDLPGLIQNADEDLISLVKSLVVRYIEGENTLILVTIPMSDDLDNQQAMRLAKVRDPTGSRTIGVLTKPDTLTAGATGALDTWKDLLMRKPIKHQLEHGYYCIKLPDDAQRARRINREDAQRVADEFFRATSPWNQMTDRSRFGIPNFVADISKHLVKLIETNLPKLRERTQELLKQYRTELANLPPPPSRDAFTEIMLHLTNLGKEVHRAVMGDTEDYKCLVQKNRKHYRDFKTAICGTCPNFVPWDHDLLEEGEEMERDLRSIEELESMNKYTTINLPPGETLNLLDVRKVIEDSVTWELPRHVPFEATKVLVRRITKQWPQPAMTCFDQVYATTDSIAAKLVSDECKQFEKLERFVSEIVIKELQDCREKALDAVRTLLDLETVPLFTQNEHYYLSCTDMWYQKYHYSRHQISPKLCLKCAVDEYEQELHLMASVRGYFQVAYKRIIDYLPLMIEHQLNQAFAENLPQRLFEGISRPQEGDSRDHDTRMRDLLSEDEGITQERQRLQDRIARLEEIQETLRRV